MANSRTIKKTAAKKTTTARKTAASKPAADTENSLDSSDLTKDGENSEEVTEGGDVDYSDTNPNPPRSESGTPLVEGSQEDPDDEEESEEDPDVENYSSAQDHVFEAPEAGKAAHGDGVLGDQISTAKSEEMPGANPPGITSTSGVGESPVLGKVKSRKNPARGNPPEGDILGPTDAPRFESDDSVDSDTHVVVKRDVYREVYFGRSKTPSYVLVFKAGTLVAKNTIAPR